MKCTGGGESTGFGTLGSESRSWWREEVVGLVPAGAQVEPLSRFQEGEAAEPVSEKFPLKAPQQKWCFHKVGHVTRTAELCQCGADPAERWQEGT